MIEEEEDFTAQFIREAKERGEPVFNEGTFRVVDAEGHIEVVDEVGPPGASAYPSRSTADLRALAKLVGVDSTGSKDDVIRRLVDLDENPV